MNLCGNNGRQRERQKQKQVRLMTKNNNNEQNELDFDSPQTITFNSEILDVGNDFDHTSGIFTCRIRGIYYFSFTFVSYDDSNSVNMEVQLKKNGVTEATVKVVGDPAEYETHSTSVILSLDKGDVVSLYNNRELDVNSNLDTNIFNGYLIHAT